MKWISVKERLPDDGIDVLVCANYENIPETYYATAFHDINGWWHEAYILEAYDVEIGECRINVDQGCITHWMRIPDPPEAIDDR